jgi:RNA polymerase sigma factor (sigma-70 family)
MIAREFRSDVVGQLDSLRRYARSLTRSSIDAEDLVHDALVRAFEKRASFRAGHNIRVWLMSILHNVFIDGTRVRRAEVQRLEQATELVDQACPPAQDHHVRLNQVREAFMALPDEQRAALHLVAIEGLGYAEAAVTLGIPVGTLMSRIARARAALRAIEDSDLGAMTLAPKRHYLRAVGGGDERPR